MGNVVDVGQVGLGEFFVVFGFAVDDLLDYLVEFVELGGGL